MLGVTQAVGAVDAVARLVDSFPPAQRAPVRSLLARTLRGVLCQRLVPARRRARPRPAVEVLVVNGPAATAIGDADGGARLDALIADGEFYGMQTFDQSLAKLYRRGLVTREDALANAVYEPGLAVMLDAADRERAAAPAPEPASAPPSPVGGRLTVLARGRVVGAAQQLGEPADRAEQPAHLARQEDLRRLPVGDRARAPRGT